LPRAWIRGTYDFSFSGLKTAMLHLAEGATADERSTAESEGKQMSHYTRMGAQAAQKGTTNVSLRAASFEEATVDAFGVKSRFADQESAGQQVVMVVGL